MAVSDWNLEIHSVVLGPGTYYIIHGVDGMGSPEVRTSDSPRPQENGDFAGTDTYGSKVLTISVTVYGDTPELCTAAYDALLSAWQLGEGEDFRNLTLRFPGRPDMVAIGRPRRVVADQFDRLKTRRIGVTLEYYSPYSFLFSAALTTTTIPIGTLSGGRTYARVYPMSYGGGSAGTQTINNTGNVTVKPVVRLYGPCVNPFIENITAGKVVSFSYVLAAGEWLEVDMDARSVLLNGTASRRSALKPSSRWWGLAPGSSSVRFGADSGTGSYAEVDARSGWLG